MIDKTFPIVVLFTILASCAATQNGQISIPANTNYTISVSCPSNNVGIQIEWMSTNSLIFQVFDNLYQTCYPNVAPNPYSSLYIPSSILVIDKQLATYTTNADLCLSFVNANSGAVTLTYQFSFICKSGV